MWLAPNLVTFSGFVFSSFATFLVLTHSPELDGSAPGWVLQVAAVCFFFYQTLDGSDGKQVCYYIFQSIFSVKVSV